MSQEIKFVTPAGEELGVTNLFRILGYLGFNLVDVEPLYATHKQDSGYCKITIDCDSTNARVVMEAHNITVPPSPPVSKAKKGEGFNKTVYGSASRLYRERLAKQLQGIEPRCDSEAGKKRGVRRSVSMVEMTPDKRPSEQKANPPVVARRSRSVTVESPNPGPRPEHAPAAPRKVADDKVKPKVKKVQREAIRPLLLPGRITFKQKTSSPICDPRRDLLGEKLTTLREVINEAILIFNQQDPAELPKISLSPIKQIPMPLKEKEEKPLRPRPKSVDPRARPAIPGCSTATNQKPKKQETKKIKFNVVKKP